MPLAQQAKMHPALRQSLVVQCNLFSKNQFEAHEMSACDWNMNIINLHVKGPHIWSNCTKGVYLNGCE